MLSVVLSATTITMNRGEQETLFRQARNLRLLTEAKAQQDKLQQQRQLLDIKPAHSRHHSFGNIHQLNSYLQSATSRSFECDQRHSFAADDLVLSVLKSPVIDPISAELQHESDNKSIATVVVGSNVITTPSPQRPGCEYPSPQNSEDELVDVESGREVVTVGSTSSVSPRALNFFKRLRQGRTSRFEAHNRRVPTQMRRKGRSRSKSKDILDGLPNTQDSDDVAISEDGPSDSIPQKEPKGIPDPYYPIALPIDQQFKTKYAFHQRRGKTFQERLYVFLEHPVGWVCFIYHTSV